MAAACTSQEELPFELRELETDTRASVLTVSGGDICGYVDGGVYVYKGIPYAKAERFCEPADADKWEGVRSCRHYGAVSPHAERRGWRSDVTAFTMDWDDGWADEDCLNLNVWTNGRNDGRKRPVMVWLHGGGFAEGCSHEQLAYDGWNLARKGDVVMVSVNHRLNAVGFLDLTAFGGDYAKSDNLGMKDIVKALEWIKTNAEAFGGDPDNVTIFGQSGGGGKVSTLLAAPSAHGLFHKAIVHSGSLGRLMEKKYSQAIGCRTAELLGLDAASIDKIKTVPYSELLAAGTKACAEVTAQAKADGFEAFLIGWAPVLDGEFLPSHPFDGEAPEISRDIPMMIGTTRTEFSPRPYVPMMRNVTDELVQMYLAPRFGDRVQEYKDAVKKAYPDCTPEDYIDVDLIFREMAVSQGDLKAAQGGAPVYMFLFSWESPVCDGIWRSTHCMDLPFAFDNVALYKTETGGRKDAVLLGHRMGKAWTNFAHTGNPNGTKGVKGLPEWPEYSIEEGATMNFNTVSTVLYGHDRELIEFDRQFGPRTLF